MQLNSVHNVLSPVADDVDKHDHRSQLRRLFTLRSYAISVQLIAIWFAKWGLDAALPISTLIIILGLLILINAVTWLRLQSSKKIHDWEFTLHLFTDMTGLATLLYFTGGATNPFISFLLLPLAIGANSVQIKQIIPLGAYGICVYSLLMFHFQPLLFPDGTFPYHLHLIGMWITFALSVLLISWYMTRTAIELRNKDRELMIIKEQEWEDQQLIALGTLAAGAAHELSTPLSTIAILAQELEETCTTDDTGKEDLRLLRSQITICRNILTDLLTRTKITRSDSGKSIDLEQMLLQIFDKWLSIKQEVHSQIIIDKESPSLTILLDPTISQAILNILNNAAEASPEFVKVQARWNFEYLVLVVEDRGPGIASEILDRIGKPFVSNRVNGHGLGLFLAKAALARFGGEIDLSNRKEGGMNATLTLPLKDIRLLSEPTAQT